MPVNRPTSHFRLKLLPNMLITRGCRLFFLTLLFLIAGTNVIFALEPGKAVTQYAHRVWLTKDGLPVNTVNFITQSSDGYLWLATHEGAVRFDGKKFAVFNKQNIAVLKTNSMTVAALANDGSVWFGTTGQGAMRLKDGKTDFFTQNEGLAGNDVTAIYQGRDGSLWFGTVKNGLSRFKNGIFTNFNNEELAQATVWNFAETADGSLWIGTNRLPIRYKNGEFKIYGQPEGITVTSSPAMRVDKNGRLWIGGSWGINVWENEAVTDYTTRTGVKDKVVMAIYEDRDENIWIGTNEEGVIRFNNRESTAFRRSDGLSSDQILNFFEDREGSLWIATESGGLNQLYDGAVTAVTTKQGLPDDSIGSLLEARNGDMWIVTNKGLTRLRDGQFTNLTDKDGLTGNHIGAIAETRDGEIWVSALGRGVDRFRDGRFQNFSSAQGFPQKHTLVIYEDSRSDLWLGTVTGLFRRRADEKTTFTVKDGLADDFVKCLTETRDGALWIGTDKGLQEFDGQNFTTYTIENGLPDNKIRSFHEDENGMLWVATNGGLAGMTKDRQFASFTSRDGLYHDVIHSILSDDKGNLWMSSNFGIFRVSKSELERFARKEIEKFESTVYDTSDGMKTREANGGLGIFPAGWRAQDGKLWFATEGGAAVVDPNNLYGNRAAPTVVVEEVLFNEKPQYVGEKLNVPAGTNRVDFTFTAPSFRAPDKLKFQYQLAGYDTEWHIPETGRRQISYTNLPPGNYVFRVRASNENGIWNEIGASLTMSVAPRFYQTYWFYTLCLVGLFGIGFLFYQLRLRQVKRRFELILSERTRIAREIHDTLAQNLLAASLQLEAAEEKMGDSVQPAIRKHVVQARTLAGEGLHQARNSIFNLRQSSDSADTGLVSELESFIAQTGGENAPQVTLRVVGKPYKLPEIIEHNFFRIGQEAVTNALKHARADNIHVELVFDRKNVRLQVTDDGRGFDIEKRKDRQLNGANGSYGLLGLTERAKIIGAQFSVKSESGKGTVVSAVIENNAAK